MTDSNAALGLESPDGVGHNSLVPNKAGETFNRSVGNAEKVNAFESRLLNY